MSNLHIKPGSPGDILEHHGVKGMKWGVRKEEDTGGRDATGKMQPTPLKPLSEKQQMKVDKFLKRADVAGTHISAIKRENAKSREGSQNPAKVFTRYANNQNIRQLEKSQKRALKDAQAKQDHKLTSAQKKAIIGGVAVTAFLAYGLYAKGNQSGAINSYKLLAQQRLSGNKSPFKLNDALRGRMSAEKLLKDVAKPVNPNYSQMGGKMNCRRCTYTYELRRRGYDVHATTSAVGWGQSESGVINALTTEGDDFFRKMSVSEGVQRARASVKAPGDTRTSPVKKILLDDLGLSQSQRDNKVQTLLNNIRRGKGPGVDLSNIKESSSKRVLEELAKQPEGARGEVLFKFPTFGHSMAYEIVDGKPHIFDSQKGTLYNSAHRVESKWDGFYGAEITRLDNVDLDINFLTRWATNTGGK